MSGHLTGWAALGVAASVLAACNPAPPQRSAAGAPALTQPGGGYEMDHRRMGGTQGPSAGSPTLTQPGGGNVEMDHSRMGGQGQPQRPGGPAPTLTPHGGSGNAEMDHSRMGGGHMGAGGTITGNPGSGPEVQHGTAPDTRSGTAARRGGCEQRAGRSDC